MAKSMEMRELSMYGKHTLLKAALIPNSNWIQLTFNNDVERSKLDSAVSFDVPGAQWSASVQSGLWSGRKSFLTKTNRMRVGLFKAIFNEHPLVYNNDSSLLTLSFDSIPLFRDNLNYERREYQLDAIKSILTNKFGLINSIMGSGKTLIISAAISYHLEANSKNRVLFVVYDRNILNQSMSNFKRYFPNKSVTQFGNGVKDLSGDIIVATIQSLNNLDDPKSVLKHVTFLAVDEVHHGKSKTSKSILNKLPNCQYRIGLTATIFKEKTIELAELHSITGPVIYEYGFSKAVEAGSVIPVRCFFLKLPIDTKVDNELTFRRNYKVIWDTGISNNEARNLHIAKIQSMLIDLMNTPTIINVDRVVHGQQLAAIMKKFPLVSLAQMYGSDDIAVRELKKEQLQADKINTIISSVLTEGVDFPISPVVAINASGRKSFIKLIQFLGRITRRNESFGKFRIMIDFINLEHRLLKEHSLERIASCKEFGCETTVCNSVSELLTEIVKYYKQTK